MSDLRQEDFGVTPTLEVRVYRDGVLVQRVLCETEEDAVATVEAAEEELGVECEVDDLSAPYHDVDHLDVERTDIPDFGEEYPTAAESSAGPESLGRIA